MAQGRTNSCAEIQIPCMTSDLFPVPCDCQDYGVCVHYNVVIRRCGPGTLFDQTITNCNRFETVVYNNRCSLAEPWSRCEEVPNHYSEDELLLTCGVLDQQQGPAELGDGAGGGGGGGSGSTSAILGGVLGGAVLIGIIIAAFFIIRWRRSRPPENKTHQTYRKNGSIHDPAKEEEVYDVIDEKVVSVGSAFTVTDPSRGDVPLAVYNNKGFEDSETATSSPEYSLAMVDDRESETGPIPEQHDHGHLKLPSQDGPNDLSRSISIGGTIVQVQDSEGYQVAHPSGSIPGHSNIEEDAPSKGYFQLEQKNDYEDY